MLRARGYTVSVHDSAQALFACVDIASAGCVILDCKMPGCSGLEVQDILAGSGGAWQIIFLTGRADVPQSVRAMKQGAVDFLLKPAAPAAVVDAVERALARFRAFCSSREETLEMMRRV